MNTGAAGTVNVYHAAQLHGQRMDQSHAQGFGLLKVKIPRKPLSVVGHGQFNPPFVPPVQGNLDGAGLAVGERVLQGVGNQLADDLPASNRVIHVDNNIIHVEAGSDARRTGAAVGCRRRAVRTPK